MIALALTLAAALPEPAIRRGDPVRIEYRRGGVLLAAEGRAVSGGAIGRVVTVLRDGGGRAVRATVRGPGLVELGAGR